jgi:hypothetical protein
VFSVKRAQRRVRCSPEQSSGNYAKSLIGAPAISVPKSRTKPAQNLSVGVLG